MQEFRDIVAAMLAETAVMRAAGSDAASIAGSFSQPPKPELGDLSFPAFTAAKALGIKPPEAAARLKAELESAGAVGAGKLVAEIKVMGPYLNLYFDGAEVARRVVSNVQAQSPGEDAHAWRYGNNESGQGKTLVIDLSSPNIAKPLGVHHLRSTMIGNAIRKIHEACGWRVVGLNYLGDWGTGFGKLIAGWLRARPEVASALASDPSDENAARLFDGVTVADLNAVYVKFNAALKEDKSLEALGKQEFAALELAVTAKDTGSLSAQSRRNLAVWKQIRRISLVEFERVYRMLGLSFVPWPLDDAKLAEQYQRDPAAFFLAHGIYVGESFGITGGDLSTEVIEAAKASGTAVESDGALVVFVDGPDKPPLILLKDDGATSYHTRDLASALYRRRVFGMEKGLYVVGTEQTLHFHQLFKALEMIGNDWASQCAHISFGLYLVKNEEGVWIKLSTRAGRSVLLHELLDEATESVRKIIVEKNPALAENKAKLDAISEAVGVGAIVFNDLKNGRKADVRFEWDEMLSFSGETGPYMLYQFVRLGSVRRKFSATHGGTATGFPAAPNFALLKLPQERELIRAVALFPETVARAARDAEPSIVSRYLLDLSSLFSSYWTATKGEGIVGEDRELSAARIALVEAVRRVLGRGLTLLGLRLVEEM